jgi:hypothetical protein
MNVAQSGSDWLLTGDASTLGEGGRSSGSPLKGEGKDPDDRKVAITLKNLDKC